MKRFWDLKHHKSTAFLQPPKHARRKERCAKMKALVKGRLLLSSPQWLNQILSGHQHPLSSSHLPIQSVWTKNCTKSFLWTSLPGTTWATWQIEAQKLFQLPSWIWSPANPQSEHHLNCSRNKSAVRSRLLKTLDLCAVNKGNDKHWTYSACQCPIIFWNDQSHLTARPARASTIAGWIAPGTNSLQSKHAMLFPSDKQKVTMTELRLLWAKQNKKLKIIPNCCNDCNK